jgi:amino acid adenylation domain-containing protein
MKQNSIKYIHNLVEDWAKKTPDKIALSYNEASLTYREINNLSNQVAWHLLSIGVKAGDFVGIFVNRSSSLLIYVLAILKSGATYIPIDTEYPEERINFILKDTQLKFLISEPGLENKITHESVIIRAEDVQFSSYSKKNPAIKLNPLAPAYVVYTSGSTGKPKGVMVSHSNIIHAYQAWKEVYELSENDIHLQMANFSFDVFTGDFVRALCSGANLVLCPRETLLNPDALYKLMIKTKINFAEFVPTVIRRLSEYIESKKIPFHFLRILIVGSDNWSMKEYKKLQKICGEQTRVINSYGVSEATIDSAYFEDLHSNTKSNYNKSVPIGKSLPNTKIYILDKNQKLVEGDKPGEILIGGKGISLGYLNRVELTKEKFIKFPLLDNDEIYYRTGDLGRYLQDGNIEFLGRIDNQVKLRGMRIELTEIENVLNSHKAIRESLVILSKNKSNDQLIAYVVFENNCSLPTDKIRTYVEKILPPYMVPHLFIPLKLLPLTPNGKLDRNFLTYPNQDEKNKRCLPRNEIEKKLASIWKNNLKITDLDIYQNFDDLGGDSLILANLLVDIEKEFKIKCCLNQKKFSIAKLAKYIQMELDDKKVLLELPITL